MPDIYRIYLNLWFAGQANDYDYHFKYDDLDYEFDAGPYRPADIRELTFRINITNMF